MYCDTFFPDMLLYLFQCVPDIRHIVPIEEDEYDAILRDKFLKNEQYAGPKVIRCVGNDGIVVIEGKYHNHYRVSMGMGTNYERHIFLRVCEQHHPFDIHSAIRLVQLMS